MRWGLPPVKRRDTCPISAGSSMPLPELKALRSTIPALGWHKLPAQARAAEPSTTQAFLRATALAANTGSSSRYSKVGPYVTTSTPARPTTHCQQGPASRYADKVSQIYRSSPAQSHGNRMAPGQIPLRRKGSTTGRPRNKAATKALRGETSRRCQARSPTRKTRQWWRMAGNSGTDGPAMDVAPTPLKLAMKMQGDTLQLRIRQLSLAAHRAARPWTEHSHRQDHYPARKAREPQTAKAYTPA